MNKKILLITVITTALILSACNFPFAKEEATATPDMEVLMATSVAGTVQAVAMAQPTLTVAAPTAEPTATLPALQPTNTVNALQPTVAPARACNEAVFVSETVPDNTQFNLSEGFTKTWTVMNTGTCTWNTNYKWVFVSGDQMEAPASVNLTQTVAPNGQITISVAMKAPYTAGTYTGYWALQGEDGVNFFTNNSIKIIASSDAFRVTSVTTNLKDREPVCPYDYYYTMSITTSSAGTVKYRLSDSESNSHSMRSLVFSSAGTQNVDVSWLGITTDGSYWVKVYIDTPNNQTFGPFKFDIDCQ